MPDSSESALSGRYAWRTFVAGFGFDHMHRCSQSGQRGWAGGPSPSLWAADALFLCGSWASCHNNGIRHQLLCSTYEDEIWRQSFLCGRATGASRAEQLPAAVHHADTLHTIKRRLESYFFSLCFNDWQCNALRVRFRVCRALNSRFYSILFYSILFDTEQDWRD